jgi:heme exporter protein A
MSELHIENVSKTYGTRRVLHNINLMAQGGEVIGIIGSNGSGKSTLLRIIAGLLRPTAGTVRLTVRGTLADDAITRRRCVGYVAPDLAFYPELSARENLAFFSKVRGEERSPREVDGLLRRVGLRGRENDAVAAFSSGMRQRLRLAFALLTTAPILLLDEPTLALDTQGVGLVEEMIAEQRATGGVVVLATNDPQERVWADRLLLVGRRATGEPSDGLAL